MFCFGRSEEALRHWATEVPSEAGERARDALVQTCANASFEAQLSDSDEEVASTRNPVAASAGRTPAGHISLQTGNLLGLQPRVSQPNTT